MMPKADADCICVEHVRTGHAVWRCDATMHARTNGLTHADASTTEEESRVSNAREEWRPVPEYEGLYEVSNTGEVRSLPREVVDSNGHVRRYPGRILSPAKNAKGYRRVSLFGGARPIQGMLNHRLVAMAFLEQPPGCDLVRHINDIPDDNRVENLAWGTNSENAYDALRNGRLFGRRTRYDVAADRRAAIAAGAAICPGCDHPIPDHDGYGRCCFTVACTCRLEVVS